MSDCFNSSFWATVFRSPQSLNSSQVTRFYSSGDGLLLELDELPTEINHKWAHGYDRHGKYEAIIKFYGLN